MLNLVTLYNDVTCKKKKKKICNEATYAES